MKTLACGLFALGALATSARAQLPGPIPIHAPCTQTLAPAVGAYSGTLAIIPWQQGVVSLNVTTGTATYKNGVWRAMLGGCSGRSDLVWDVNDCWQSVATITASNGSPKWLLATDAPSGCGSASHPVPPGMNGLMVWKWNGSAFDVVGLIQPPSGKKVRELGTPVLAGDVAWVELTNNVGWVSCDLNASSCAWGSPQPGPAAGEGRQANVGGFTYNVGIDFAHPNENGGPVYFWAARADQPTPTRPPASTATKTPTGGTPRTSTPPRPTPTFDPCSLGPCPPTPTRGAATKTPTTVPLATATPAPAGIQVAVFYTVPGGTESPARVGGQVGPSGGWWWFFTPDNPELFVQVTNGCGTNGNRWVKVYGGTNVAVRVVVTDLGTGAARTYTNDQGALFRSVIDTAFEPCN